MNKRQMNDAVDSVCRVISVGFVLLFILAWLHLASGR